jgi:endonuclease/exonuclease/phosphatase (EEP) superfamily protein YafD
LSRRRWLALLPLPVTVPLFPELFRLDGFTPFAQLAAFRPQGIAVLGLCGALLLSRRASRPAGVVLLVPTLIAAALTAPRLLSEADEAPGGGRELTIMAANVLGGGARPASVAGLIRSRRPAFVALPEAREDVRRQVEAELTGLGYRGFTVQTTTSPVSATSVLVSGELGEVRFGSDDGATTFGHVIAETASLRLVAYHSYPPLPGETHLWRRDQEALKRWCSGGVRTIVAGDFNATLDHAALRDGLGECRSAAAAVGKGLAGTWPAGRPGVFRTQIDHVVGTRDVTATGFSTYDIEGSDHRAVVATVVLG